MAVREAPTAVVKLALRAGQFIGDGLYGMNLSQIGERTVRSSPGSRVPISARISTDGSWRSSCGGWNANVWAWAAETGTRLMLQP